jgi:hypothetical protein
LHQQRPPPTPGATGSGTGGCRADLPMRVAPALPWLPPAEWGCLLARVDNPLHRRHLREVPRTIPRRTPPVPRTASDPRSQNGPLHYCCVAAPAPPTPRESSRCRRSARAAVRARSRVSNLSRIGGQAVLRRSGVLGMLGRPASASDSRESGETGRRAGLRIRWARALGGSTPPSRTTLGYRAERERDRA